MLKISKVKGVTLLEMLLVIAVSATLMVGTLSLMRSKALNVKNDKTIFIMQQWLQAALSYYVVNQAQSVQNEDIKSLLVKDGYMPPGENDTNPWGNSYNVMIKGDTINVTTLIPEPQAKIIQANLPYTPSASQNTDQNVILSAPVPLPDAAAIQYSDIVEGTRDDPAIVPAPTCPEKRDPEIYAVPVMYSSGPNAYPIVQVGAYAEVVKNEDGTKIASWKVYSKLYTAKGDANDIVDNKTFKNYNRILVMTKCPQVPNQLYVSNDVQTDNPLVVYK
jgi:prepilin-type N-terminal cleavage/methylation domain-containing protein